MRLLLYDNVNCNNDDDRICVYSGTAKVRTIVMLQESAILGDLGPATYRVLLVCQAVRPAISLRGVGFPKFIKKHLRTGSGLTCMQPATGRTKPL